MSKNSVILHVRRFSEYALAGASSGGSPSGGGFYPPPVTPAPITPVPVVAAPTATQFEIDAYAGNGGTITDPGKTYVNPGAGKEYRITPNKGYRILDVFVDGVSVGGAESYTFTDINSSRTINAVFTDEKNYIIDAQAGSGGSTTKPGRTAHAPFTKHTYTFMPDEGCYVQDVLINGVSVGTVYNYTIESLQNDVTIYVSFARKTEVKLNSYDHYSYIVGYPDGTVQPEGSITREEVAAIFFRLLTPETRGFYFTRENTFEDVVKDRWSNSSVSTLANAGILVGRNPSRILFDPSGKITRAEVVSMAARFFEVIDGSSDRFGDIAGHCGMVLPAYSGSYEFA